MASFVIKETRFSYEPLPISSFDSSCGAPHQLLRLIAELNVVPPELADVICKRRPSLINIHHNCSVSCRRGMLKLCNLRFQPPIRMNVYLGYSPDEEEMSFVQKLIKSKSIECSKIWIKAYDHTELWNNVRGFRIGQADSVQQVSIDCFNIEGIPHFAQMENLQSLEISLNDSTDEEMRILEAILKRNKLSELTIDSYKYSGRLESVLNEGFHSMSSLRELRLRRVNIIHLPNLRHLDLINFSLLRTSTLNDDGIAVLSDALRSWRNLQQLSIDFDKNVSVAECSLWKLFEAIAGCHRLQILHFDCLEMADSVVPSVCEMIESLKQLRKFTSKRQRNESLTEEGFKQLEPIIKRNGLNTKVN
ncbi:hypothetical protein CAPTEDRAFT_220295 [Capitella teleta]|uniref:F-box domain-containing protein n=1 Tax=Capitella teleta TaxID=283909 RepID=R7VJQ3_CAPTE|nr:hypothetical protein CAPTEDRAFT_220295 [Capitella teleta]|eukprot:ELU16120.1 hypothetical protein CAPTEDRAFT_220295 [Capitella teleta]